MCCASLGGAALTLPAAPSAVPSGAAPGGQIPSQRGLVWRKDSSLPGQGRTEGKGTVLSHHLLGGSAASRFSLPRAYDKVTAWT